MYMYLVSIDCTSYLLFPISYLLPPRECIRYVCIHVDVDVDLYLDTHMYI